MELCLIWAQGPNREIGRNNELPWHLPEDLAHFKTTTMGCPVIMGRRTFESLPHGALPGRLNVVLTRGVGVYPRASTAESLTKALALASETAPARVFVIGGAAVYEEALAIADTLFVTQVDEPVADADAFAPVIPATYKLAHAEAWQTSRKGPRYSIQRWSAQR